MPKEKAQLDPSGTDAEYPFSNLNNTATSSTTLKRICQVIDEHVIVFGEFVCFFP